MNVENAADAETGHVACCFFSCPTIFFCPLNHLSGEICRDHSVAAHGGELQGGPVRQLVHPAAETDRILNAVTSDAGLLAAAAGIVHRGAGVDGDAELRAFGFRHKGSHWLGVVEDRCHRGMPFDPGNHLLGVGAVISSPVGGWVHVLARPEDTSLGGISDVDRFVFECQVEEAAVLFDQVVVIEFSAGHREDDVVILDRLGIASSLEGVVFAVAMQRISHILARPKRPICSSSSLRVVSSSNHHQPAWKHLSGPMQYFRLTLAKLLIASLCYACISSSGASVLRGPPPGRQFFNPHFSSTHMEECEVS